MESKFPVRLWQKKIIILDFGSQVTQLIGRRLRELNVYCEIYPFNKVPALDSSVKGVILSGSPCSVRDKNAPQIDLGGIKGRFPLLGICYGAQYLAHKFGGEVLGSLAREYGRAMLDVVDPESPLLKGVSAHSQVWMSHGDTIARLPEGAEVIASTESVTNAAFHIKGEQTYAVQFHPEVFHTTEGTKILGNFALGICGCKGDWTPASFIETTVASLREQIGDEKVILGLSGGVDSTVAGVLLTRPSATTLTCMTWTSMSSARTRQRSSLTLSPALPSLRPRERSSEGSSWRPSTNTPAPSRTPAGSPREPSILT